MKRRAFTKQIRAQTRNVDFELAALIVILEDEAEDDAKEVSRKPRDALRRSD